MDMTSAGEPVVEQQPGRLWRQGMQSGQVTVLTADQGAGISLLREAAERLGADNWDRIMAAFDRHAQLTEQFPDLTRDQAWDAVTAGGTDTEVSEWMETGWPRPEVLAALSGLRRVHAGAKAVGNVITIGPHVGKTVLGSRLTASTGSV